MDILPHIDYVARRIGSDHVVLGSDFDGVIMPRELGNAAGMPKLINHLQGKIYASDALRKATHANWVRWVEQTIKQQNLNSLHQLT